MKWKYFTKTAFFFFLRNIFLWHCNSIFENPVCFWKSRPGIVPSLVRWHFSRGRLELIRQVPATVQTSHLITIYNLHLCLHVKSWTGSPLCPTCGVFRLSCARCSVWRRRIALCRRRRRSPTPRSITRRLLSRRRPWLTTSWLPFILRRKTTKSSKM